VKECSEAITMWRS